MREQEVEQLQEAQTVYHAHMSDEEMASAREQLFQKGSTFLPAHKEDIVGIDNVLSEVDDVIHWLNHVETYRKYNSRLEPGLVFEGSPGTGKTLVSRYIATQSKALFVNVRDFPHRRALLSDRDIAELFRLAREAYRRTQTPVILFWDEFEANATERVKAATDQASASAQLTAELDGVHGKNEGILLIGCTNYLHMIDQALLRSGRMGIQIEFNAPSREGKESLLKHYLDKTTTTGAIDIETLSYFFGGDATAADIEEACVEAWRYAVRRSIEEKVKVALAQEDLVNMFVKRLVGPPTSFVNVPLDTRRKIALHEVGHALTALIYGIPLRLITVRPGKDNLGRCITYEPNEFLGTQQDWLNQLRVVLGSLGAEIAADLDPSIGSHGDISTANRIARKLIDDLNYDAKLGIFNPGVVGEGRAGDMEPIAPAISNNVLQIADVAIRNLLCQFEEDSQRVMLQVGKDSLWAIADEVNNRVTLTGKEFEEAVLHILSESDLAKYRI